MKSKILFFAALLIAKSNEVSSKTSDGKEIDGHKIPGALGVNQYTWSWWWDMWIKLSLKICKATCPLLKGRSCQQIEIGLWCCLKVDCGKPSQIGYKFGDPQPNTKYDATVSVQCADGYETSPEKSILKCQADGTWEAGKGCSRKDCDTPNQVGYEFGDPDPDTKFGSSVAVWCAECYTGGPDKLRLFCDANGKWEDGTGCNKIICEPPPDKDGYEFDDPEPDATCGSKLPLRCAAGYVNAPTNPLLTCKADGYWEEPTGCERINCETPRQEGYEFGDPNPDTKFGSLIDVWCAQCYGGAPDKSSLSCQANGEWEIPNGCNKISCGPPPDKLGYEFGDPVPDMTCGSTVTVQCAEGYVNAPTKTSLICQANGEWEQPTGCERINCGNPSQEGYEFGEPVPDTKLGSEVSVACSDGYETVPDEASLTCLATGKWRIAQGCNRIACAGTLSYVQCDSWGFKYHECPITGADVILNAVVAKKNSVSQCSNQGAGITPANYTENMATLGLYGHMNNVLWVHSGCRANISVCHTDCGPWHLAYEHDSQGNHISGSKASLIDKVKNGANVRVLISRANPYVTSVQNAYVIGNELCAQALFHVSNNGYSKFQTNAYWWFSNVCTTGHWQMSRYYVGDHDFISKNTVRFDLKWFVREEGQTHLLTLDSTGGVVAGSKSYVVNAIKQGHHVRISSFGYNYSFPVDSLEHNADESLGVGTALWHVSQQNVIRDGYNIKDFQLNACWWFILKTTNSDLKVSRWRIGDHTQPSSGNSVLKKEAKWYADPCWQPVYKHNASGHSISGNRTELVNKIQSGYRVKVLFRNMSLEADEILIRQEGQVQHVCVSLLNDLSKPTIDTFDAGLSWVWRQCCTTGRCETLKYQVGANVQTHSSIEAETITWFVDSPRNWIPVLSVATDGTVISGSKAALTNAIRAGSEVRYNLVDVYTDEPGFSIAHQADNVAIDGTEVGAMHVRAISVSREGDYEISFQSKPYWWFTIITTTGRFERSRWTVGVHEARPHDSRQIAVDWFVNGSA